MYHLKVLFDKMNWDDIISYSQGISLTDVELY